jgi:hypothetical protein
MKSTKLSITFTKVSRFLGLENTMKYQRFDKNVPGDFYTTGECLACGLPENEAPNLLAKLDDENSDTYFIKQPETLEEINDACWAAKVCCVDAIRYCGNNPQIKKQLGSAYCDKQ